MRRLRDAILRRESPQPTAGVDDVQYNGVLGSRAEYEQAITWLGAEHDHFPAKSWDLFLAVHHVVEHQPDQAAAILDAGCSYSPILARLHARGYRRLVGIDLTDERLPEVPGVELHRADATATPFPDGRFATVCSLSVIEHGVGLDSFFAEMVRVLAPGGHLLLSTDYWEPKLDTTDVDRAHTYGAPWTIFDRTEAEALVAEAARHGLDLSESVDWRASDGPVEWLGLRYTFLFLAFTRRR